MGCGQSKTSSKSLNLRKLRLDDDQKQKDDNIVVDVSNSSPDKDEGANRRSAVDDDNANHATSSAVLKRTQRPKKTSQPGATTDAIIDIDNHSLTVSCREITGAKGGGEGSTRASNLMNDLDTTGSTTLDKNTDCFQEKQARFSVPTRTTAKDWGPSRLNTHQSNLTASQIEFFRMVDEKIEQGKEYQSDEER